MTRIGDIAFDYCSDLTFVVIPEGVTSIGYSAFGHCSNLASINIPEGVTYIGDYAFNGCSSLASINIPEKVKSIGQYTFYGCSMLTEVFCHPVTPPSCGMYGTSFPSTTAIYVPMESVEAYKQEWSDYADQIQGYEF